MDKVWVKENGKCPDCHCTVREDFCRCSKWFWNPIHFRWERLYG